MVVEVNRAIGQSICMDAEDVLVVSGRAAVYLEGHKVVGSHILIFLGNIYKDTSKILKQVRSPDVSKYLS